MCTNKLDIDNDFSHLFTGIGPKLAEGIPCTNANNFTKFFKNKNGFRFTELQEESVS